MCIRDRRWSSSDLRARIESGGGVVEIILLKDVDSLGEKGEMADVSGGYARNYLIPRGFAEQATQARKEAALRQMEQKAEREYRAAEQAGELKDLLAKTVLTLPVAAGEGDRLFGSVTTVSYTH